MPPAPDPLVPGHRSRFGGLWPDRFEAEALLEDRLARSELSAEEARLVHAWRRDGFVVLEGAVDAPALAALEAEILAIWRGEFPRAHVEYWQDGEQRIVPVQPEHEALQAKLLDAHAVSSAARRAIFAPRTLRMLRILFESEPLAFQTLYFQRGTEQPIHQDTAYVLVDSPLSLVGSWMALEDIEEGSGELEYYVGSHRLPEFDWGSGTKGMPPGHPEHERWLAWLHEQAAELGLERRRFRPRRGDVLLWHADLGHGGSPVTKPQLSRRSLVTHYCPERCSPGYFRHHAHSRKLRAEGGGNYCYPCRWEPQGPDEVAAGG